MFQNMEVPISAWLGKNSGFPLEEKKRRRQYYLVYTIAFVLLCLVVFCWYYLTGRTLIWSYDGWSQHFRALAYYAKYMREIASTLITEHRLVVPEWDFALGEGNDILETLHYYVIGDPFALLSVLVPTRLMYLYYDGMILLRLYLAGIAFSCLCFYLVRNRSRCAVLAGALSYVFCYWSIYNASRHPYFLNPMLYFPLLILGVEKILHREKSLLFLLTVFLSAISNFYFFYMLALMTAGYALIRLVVAYRRDWKEFVARFLALLGNALAGVLMASVILLPMIFTFLSDARAGSNKVFYLLYPLSYYSKLPAAFLTGSGDYWLLMGYSAPVLMAIILMLRRRKKYTQLKLYLAICCVFMLVPIFGQILNGLSYRSNRWSWVFALLCAYILTEMWPELMHLDASDVRWLFGGVMVCFICCMLLEYSRTTGAFVMLCLAFGLLFLLSPDSRQTGASLFRQWKKPAAGFLALVVSIGSVSFFLNASGAGNYASKAVETEKAADGLLQNEATIVGDIAKQDGVTEFYRFSGRGLTSNANMTNGLSSTQYYWTISNPYIAKFMDAVDHIESGVYNHSGEDDRTALLALSSVRYYATKDQNENLIPYGFEYVDTIDANTKKTLDNMEKLKQELGAETLTEEQKRSIDGVTSNTYNIYRNQYPLPLAYAYPKAIDRTSWETLPAVERQEAMLQAVVLDECETAEQNPDLTFTGHIMNHWTKDDDKNVIVTANKFVVTAAGASVTLRFSGEPNSETYVAFENLQFEPASDYDRYFGKEEYDPHDLYSRTRWNLLSFAQKSSIQRSRLFDTEPDTATLTLTSSAQVSKSLRYYTEEYSWYTGRHNFAVNLGYQQEPVNSVTIQFSEPGIYRFDALDVWCQPMDNYVSQVTELQQHAMQNTVIGVDTVSGDISLEKPAYLCLNIPYSKGWTAFVDGSPAKLYQANVKYMALSLTAGNHRIRLEYQSPYLRVGAVLSAVGIVIFLVLLATKYRGKRRSFAKVKK